MPNGVRKPRRLGPYANVGVMDQEQLTQMADVFRKIMESVPQTSTLEKKALSVKEVCAYVGGITNPTYYDKIFPEVPSYTIGRRRYTLKSDIDAWLASRKEAAVQ